ncbi:hypothetical protein Ocin01_08264 [Orchesella cincta]|uniref:F-box domain-containing protein n=1 Tax=Orchesella cincta TaxID=48709 RepID=A0A1D2MZE7_ORCCI|nr:hypothetical protein Ocin01_08264 [Orchesella cincta]
MLTRSASKRFREEGSDNARAVGSHQTFSDSEDSKQENVSIKSPLLLQRDRKNFNDLPNEVIAEILSKLDCRSFLQVRRVCKRWRALSNDIVYCTETSPIENHAAKLRDWYDFKWYMDSIARCGDSFSPFPSGAVCFSGFGLNYLTAESHPYYQTQFVSIHEQFLSVCGIFIQDMSIEQMKLSKKNLHLILTSPANLKSLKVDGSWIEGEAVTENEWSMIRVNNLQKLIMKVQVFVCHVPGSSEATTIAKWEALAADFAHTANDILSKCNGKNLSVLDITGVDIISSAFLKSGSSMLTSKSTADQGQTAENFIKNFSRFTKMKTLSLDVGGQLVLTSTLCSLPYSCLRELSIDYSGTTITHHHLEQLAKFGSTLCFLSIDFQQCDNQECFQKNTFKNFRLQLDKLKTLRMIYFLGHLDFVLGFHKSLETLELSYQEQSIHALFNNRQTFFNTLPKLHKLTVGVCTLYRQHE